MKDRRRRTLIATNNKFRIGGEKLKKVTIVSASWILKRSQRTIVIWIKHFNNTIKYYNKDSIVDRVYSHVCNIICISFGKEELMSFHWPNLRLIVLGACDKFCIVIEDGNWGNQTLVGCIIIPFFDFNHTWWSKMKEKTKRK